MADLLVFLLLVVVRMASLSSNYASVAFFDRQTTTLDVIAVLGIETAVIGCCIPTDTTQFISKPILANSIVVECRTGKQCTIGVPTLLRDVNTCTD